MENEPYHLEIAKADREAFVLCLALGTLEAMRTGAWPLEAGIWTLGRPVFLHSLDGVDEAVVDALLSADELSALAKLGGHSAAAVALDSMIELVRSRLSEMPEKSWYARWSDERKATQSAA